MDQGSGGVRQLSGPSLPSETTFAAAPRRNVSGLAVSTGEGLSAVIIVLPKAWANQGKSAARAVHWSGDEAQLTLALHEGDVCTVQADTERVALIESCVRHSIWRAGESPERGPLLEPAVATAPATSDEADVGLLGPLLDFAARLGQLQPLSEAVHGNAASAALLRPLLYLTFLSEVEQQLKHIRRDYEPASETLGVLRGRVDSRSLALALASRVPRVHCHYEDFTHRTPLMRVLTTASEVVTWDRSIPSAYSDSFEISRIGDRAIRIRRELDDVDILERRIAVDVGRRLRLNRASVRWQTALDLALAILAATEYLPPGEAGRQRTIEIRLNTDDMWQSVLLQALRLAAKTGLVTLHSIDRHTDAAWIPNGAAPGAKTADPDYLVSTPAPERLWCLDAKYKILDEKSPPSDDDRYQMFAYTHLATASSSPTPFVSHAALLYPSAVPSTPPIDRVRYDRGGAGVPSIPLFVERLPFPKPSDLRSDTNWHGYVGQMSNHLIDFLSA